MRILVDATYARQAPHSGHSVVLDRLVAALRALPDITVDTVAGARRHPAGGDGLASAANALEDQRWTQYELPRRARAAGADVIHHPLPAHAYAPGAPPQVVTVHDLGFELLAANFSPNHRRYAARRPPRRAPAGVQYEALLTDVYEAARPGALPEYLLEPDAALAS